MTLLAELTLTIQPAEALFWSYASGLPIRTWFIEQLPEQIASIASLPDGRRPYTCSALLDIPDKGREHVLAEANSYRIRVTTLVDELSQWLGDSHEAWQGKTIL